MHGLAAADGTWGDVGSKSARRRRLGLRNGKEDITVSEQGSQLPSRALVSAWPLDWVRDTLGAARPSERWRVGRRSGKASRDRNLQVELDQRMTLRLDSLCAEARGPGPNMARGSRGAGACVSETRARVLAGGGKAHGPLPGVHRSRG